TALRHDDRRGRGRRAPSRRRQAHARGTRPAVRRQVRRHARAAALRLTNRIPYAVFRRAPRHRQGVMNLLLETWMDEVADAGTPRGYGGRFYGAYPAIVKDIKDPGGQGRVKDALPWSPDGGGRAFRTSARRGPGVGREERR